MDYNGDMISLRWKKGFGYNDFEEIFIKKVY